ncbi:hypothetical protein CgunFtcFv8_003535 [Champsocephalus gunnari]|uniref:Uncharacterized protein n=1 Tax=Champsocephalus gunnari TaxID=52237 RepID=A0AAN8E0P1_CHAGU|nr:hypothetical protein CgunFtcFv8_003535 [Champsocephalus gunnari]
MMVPRKRKDSTAVTGESHRVLGGWGCGLPKVHNHLHCLESVELQVVVPTPGHQMVHLPPVGRLVPTRDESDEGGVV